MYTYTLMGKPEEHGKRILMPKTSNKLSLYSVVIISILFSITSHAQSKTLQAVLQRGYLICGVSQGLPGFSTVDAKGHWQGIDVDFCHAVGAAVLGDANKVKFVPLSAEERFTALQSGEIDLLARNTTWTFERDTSLGVNFIGVLYYDYQGLMVHRSINAKSVKDLDGAVICTNRGTTTELNIADYFQAHHLKYEIITFAKSDETLAAYETGRCDVYSTDASGLAAQRLKLANKADHIILPDRISKEPLSPLVRQGDNQWSKIVKWTLFALINAEEMKMSSQNIDSLQNSKDINILRLLGKEGNLGEEIGLNKDWIYQVIKQVGNYDEIFQRNLGRDSPLQIERGINALWNQGGILYAPPFR